MKDICKRISKMISSAIFTVLVILIVIILIYVVRVKYLESQGRIGEVRVNFYTVLTQSMYPSIKAGDIVITYKDDQDLYNVGDVITFVSNGKLTNGTIITHRVIGVSQLNEEYSYQTKGDNNNTEDNSSVPSNNVIGRVVFRIPKAGYIQQFLVTKTGWIVAIVLPCLGIMIYDIIKLIMSINNKTKKQNKIVEDEETLEKKKQLKEMLENEKSKSRKS